MRVMNLLMSSGAVLLLAFSVARPQVSEKAIRVGVYDNRAIAVAWAPSKHNPVGEWTRELEAAKAAGDTSLANELEKRGQRLQRQLHRQGFGRVPVDDLLAHVEDQLAAVAEAAGVDVIAWHCDYSASNVELVDITDELVQLFEPSERTLKFVADLKDREPVDLDVLERSHEH